MADKLYFSRDTEVYLQMTADHGGGTGGTVWKIPVLDGFSFSQATNASEITLSEAVSNNSARGKSRRSRQMFNDSYAPAEWSFSTYMRPFKSAVNASNGWSPTGTSADVHSVEEALWANFVSNPSFTRGVSGTDAAWTAPNPHASSGNINPVKNDVNFKLINFKSSEVAALGEFDLYFKLGGTSGQIVGTASTQLNYRIADCVVNEVTIDFDIDGIATLNWSGMGRIITEEASTPSTNLISEGADTDSNFIRNRLSIMSVVQADADELLETGETDSDNTATTYDIVLTGGNITFSNNITFLTPETLGVVNQPIGHVTGTRSVSGNFTSYLNDDTDSTSTLFARIIEDSDTVTNKFNVTFNIGGLPKITNGGTTVTVPFASDGANYDTAGDGSGTPTETDNTSVVVNMPRCHFELPTHSLDDIISLDTNFHALPADNDPGATEADYEAIIIYSGPTPS
tara:strand:+ start:3106 stop:4476 length:1371 start_codon:yes stop_codon:yes gene_type:complete